MSSLVEMHWQLSNQSLNAHSNVSSHVSLFHWWPTHGQSSLCFYLTLLVCRLGPFLLFFLVWFLPYLYVHSLSLHYTWTVLFDIFPWVTIYSSHCLTCNVTEQILETKHLIACLTPSHQIYEQFWANWIFEFNELWTAQYSESAWGLVL